MLFVVRGQADGAVDLGLALLVRGGEADGAEHLVHLLEREALGLGDEEEDEQAADERESLWSQINVYARPERVCLDSLRRTQRSRNQGASSSSA